MLFNIPQFIEKEDKIVGFLTAKQLGWMFGAGTVLLVLWSILDTAGFILAAIPVLGIFGAFAFFRPNGMPLITFFLASINFVFHPRVYIWKRVIEKEIKKQAEKKQPEIIKVQKEVNADRIEEISKLLDQQPVTNNQRPFKEM